jgi:hypothetical protein
VTTNARNGSTHRSASGNARLRCCSGISRCDTRSSRRLRSAALRRQPRRFSAAERRTVDEATGELVELAQQQRVETPQPARRDPFETVVRARQGPHQGPGGVRVTSPRSCSSPEGAHAPVTDSRWATRESVARIPIGSGVVMAGHPRCARTSLARAARPVRVRSKVASDCGMRRTCASGVPPGALAGRSDISYLGAAGTGGHLKPIEEPCPRRRHISIMSAMSFPSLVSF